MRLFHLPPIDTSFFFSNRKKRVLFDRLLPSKAGTSEYYAYPVRMSQLRQTEINQAWIQEVRAMRFDCYLTSSRWIVRMNVKQARQEVTVSLNVGSHEEVKCALKYFSGRRMKLKHDMNVCHVGTVI